MLTRLSYDILYKLYSIAGGRRHLVLRSLMRYSALPVIRILQKKVSMELHPDLDWAAKLRLLMGWYEYYTVEVCKTLLRPGMIVLDVGAHNGYYSRLFSKLVHPGGKVWAFEPHPENYYLLCQNTRPLKYRNVIPVRKAISNQVGQADFFDMAGSGQHSLFDVSKYLSHFTLRGKIRVETTTIDAFLAQEGNPEISFIKVDIEGGEVAALAGMSETIARSSRLALVVEFNPGALLSAGVKPSEFLHQLCMLGFAVKPIRPDVPLGESDRGCPKPS